MPDSKRVVLSWSSGKDSAWTLYQLQQQGVEVVALLTTFNEAFDRVAMHGTRRALVEAQSAAAGVPLFPVQLPWPCSNAQYETIMESALQDLREQYRPSHIAFGDLFLEDVRDYRIKQMANTGIELLFPLWGVNTELLSRAMVRDGLRATLTCVNPKQLAKEFAGQEFNSHFLDSLPKSVDPCGENGEFHSFVHSGPMFHNPITVQTGDIVERDGFCFADVDFAR